MKQTNCPNCGSPIMAEKCPYCGTLFYDFAVLDADEPFYLKIKHKGKIYIMNRENNSIRKVGRRLCNARSSYYP